MRFNLTLPSVRPVQSKVPHISHDRREDICRDLSMSSMSRSSRQWMEKMQEEKLCESEMIPDIQPKVPHISHACREDICRGLSMSSMPRSSRQRMEKTVEYTEAEYKVMYENLLEKHRKLIESLSQQQSTTSASRPNGHEHGDLNQDEAILSQPGQSAIVFSPQLPSSHRAQATTQTSTATLLPKILPVPKQVADSEPQLIIAVREGSLDTISRHPQPVASPTSIPADVIAASLDNENVKPQLIANDQTWGEPVTPSDTPPPNGRRAAVSFTSEEGPVS